jgi:hypothetical protein
MIPYSGGTHCNSTLEWHRYKNWTWSFDWTTLVWNWEAVRLNFFEGRWQTLQKNLLEIYPEIDLTSETFPNFENRPEKFPNFENDFLNSQILKRFKQKWNKTQLYSFKRNCPFSRCQQS